MVLKILDENLLQPRWVQSLLCVNECFLWVMFLECLLLNVLHTLYVVYA